MSHKRHKYWFIRYILDDVAMVEGQKGKRQRGIASWRAKVHTNLNLQGSLADGVALSSGDASPCGGTYLARLYCPCPGEPPHMSTGKIKKVNKTKDQVPVQDCR